MGRWFSLLMQGVGWLIGGLLALAFVAFVGLTATSTGTRWLAEQAQQYVPGLSIGELHGNLWQGLSLDRLVFSRDDGLSLSLGKASIQLDWRQFWHFSLQIRSLNAEDVVLRLPPPAASDSPSEPLNLSDLPLSLPVDIDVRHLKINRLTLWQRGHDIQNPNPIFSLTTLQAEGWSNRQDIYLKIHRLVAKLPGQTDSGSAVFDDAQNPTIDAQGTVTLAVASPHHIRGELSGLVSLPEGWLLVQTRVSGNLANVQTHLNARWEGFTSPSASLTAAAQVNTRRVELKTLNIDTLNGMICGSGAVDFAQRLQVSIHGEAVALNPAAIVPAAAGQVGFHYQLSFAQAVAQSDEMANKGASSRVSFKLTDLAGYLAEVPFDALTVDGTLADQQLKVAVTNGTLAGGALTAKAKMGLTESRPVMLDLALDHAALEDLLAQTGVNVQGRIGTHLNLSGTLGADPMRDARLNFVWSIPATAVNFTALAEQKNTVRVPLSLALQGDVAGQRLSLKQARVNLADASIDAKGDLSLKDPASDSALALTLNMKIPDLSHFPWRALNLPDLSGAIDLKTRLSGNLLQPEGTVNLAASDLVYAKWHLAKLSLDGRVNADKASGFDITLRADQLIQTDAQKVTHVLLKKLRLDAQGQWPRFADADNKTTMTQRLTMSAQGSLGRLDLALDGAISQGKNSQVPSWRGRLTRLDLLPADIKDRSLSVWRLMKPAPLIVSAREQSLGETCLTPDSARHAKGRHVCLGVRQTVKDQGKQQTAQLDADLPLTLIQQWLPVTGDLPGRVTLVAKGVATSGQVNGTLKLALPDNEFRLPDLLGDQSYHYSDTALTATLKSGVVDLNMQANVPKWLTLKGGGTVALTGMQALSLHGAAHLLDASVLARVFPEVAQIKGRAEAQWTVAGTLKEPKPSGHVLVDQLAFSLPDTGVAYDRGKLDARIDAAGRLVFSGDLTGVVAQVQTDPETPALASETRSTTSLADRHIIIQGTGDLAHLPRWQVQASVHSQALPVLRLPNLLIDASADLAIDANTAGAKISGTITLPTVTARVEKLPEGVVKSSSDLVLVGEKKSEPQEAYPIVADIKVILGRAVSLSGMGFSTGLAGKLNLKLRPNKPLAAVGEIDLINGAYKAYGQKLTVEQGRLLFVGPLGDPGISATAQRVVDSTTVGLHITGTLYHPQTTVFSSPSLSESDALSMLLTGRPLSDSGGGDRAMLMNAIAGLGISQGNDIVRDIGQKFGFDALGLDTTGGLVGARLSMGKQINDRLLVRYAVGVVSGVTEIVTQYKLSRLFSIEIITSPEATGGDLIYRIH